jgi:hypothetical protein
MDEVFEQGKEIEEKAKRGERVYEKHVLFVNEKKFPHSFEYGKAGKRLKLYFDTPETLKKLIRDVEEALAETGINAPKPTDNPSMRKYGKEEQAPRKGKCPKCQQKKELIEFEIPGKGKFYFCKECKKEVEKHGLE